MCSQSEWNFCVCVWQMFGLIEALNLYFSTRKQMSWEEEKKAKKLESGRKSNVKSNLGWRNVKGKRLTNKEQDRRCWPNLNKTDWKDSPGKKQRRIKVSCKTCTNNSNWNIYCSGLCLFINHSHCSQCFFCCWRKQVRAWYNWWSQTSFLCFKLVHVEFKLNYRVRNPLY